MAKLRTWNEFYADLRVDVLRTLQESPFHYYKKHDGQVVCGHLLHPADYQRLMICLDWFWSNNSHVRGDQPTASALMEEYRRSKPNVAQLPRRRR